MVFGNLYNRYKAQGFIRKRGAGSMYRKLGRFKRYRYFPGRRYGRRTKNPKSANRAITAIHRIEQYNGGTGVHAIDLVSGTLDVHKHIAVMLSEFPGTGPFAKLYHQYRITKVILEFFPVNIQGRHNTGTEDDFCNLYTPTLYTAVNRTADTFADNVTKIASTNSMRSVTAGLYLKRVFTPCTLDQVYESPATTSYNPEYMQWLSTADTSAPHFGMDILLSSTGSPKCSFKYKLRTTVVVQYKNRKPNIDLS